MKGNLVFYCHYITKDCIIGNIVIKPYCLRKGEVGRRQFYRQSGDNEAGK